MSNSKYSFFWHDYETFGAQTRRDRPAQFAGIRTDLELNQIGESVDIFCRPSNEYLPNPEACLITKITPQICLERGIAENQFAAEIAKHLGASGTIGVGYNSIKFDDEIGRFLFWRNLINPYAREWQNDCSRWDLLNVARVTWALRPEGIHWPLNPEGKTSLKLEDLAKANNLLHEQAHDALSDVKATIALAKLFKEKQPKLFNFCLNLRHKKNVLDQIGNGLQPILHISGMFGVDKGYLALVIPLAWHPKNKNELIVWDLAENPQELLDLSAEDVAQRIFSKTDDLAVLGLTRLPIKTIHINQSPIVINQLNALTPKNIERWNLNLQQSQKHANILQDKTKLNDLFSQIYHRDFSDMLDVDEALYAGFISNNDQRCLEYLLTLNGEQLVASTPTFNDARLEELFFRYRARNYPDLIKQNDRNRWQELRNLRLNEGQNGYLTRNEFNLLLDNLSNQENSNISLLDQLREYADKTINH